MTGHALSGRRIDVFRAAVTLLSLGVAAFIAWPVLAATVDVLTGDLPNQAADSSVIGAATSGETLRALGNTLLVVSVAGALALVVGGLFAWLNERTNARIGALAEIMPLLSLFVPPLASTIGWVLLADPDVGLLNTAIREAVGVIGVTIEKGPINLYSWYGLILAYTAYLVPFTYLSIVTAFQSLDSTLEEASSVSGASPLRTFRKVVLPSMRPALGAALLAITTLGLAMFSIPVIIGTRAGIDILPVKIVYDVTREFPMDLTSALGRTCLLLVVVGLIWLGQRRLLGGAGQAFATIGGKHSRVNRVDLGRWRLPARVLLWGYIVVVAVLPILGLLLISLQNFWSPSFDVARLTFDNYRDLFRTSETRDGLINSVTFAFIGACAVVALAFLVAHVTELWRGRTRRLVDGAVKIPIALTHIFVAIALILTFGGPPFGWAGTSLMIVVAYAVMYFPQGTFYVNSGVQQVGRGLLEASTISGATTGATARRVLLPLTAPSLIAGWGLVFVLMMGDVTASAMLASSSTPVVGFVMLDAWTSGTYPQLASIGVVMSLTSTAIVLAAMAVGRRRRIDR